jgi:hypothetical protein
MTGSRRIFHAILALTVAAHAVVLIVRIVSVLRFSALVPSPIEGPGLYAIWKIQHGYALYEWPTRPFFGLTLYNFLFYETYARLLAILGVTSAAIPTGAKLLTLPFAIAGAIVQYAATRTSLRRFPIPNHRVLAAAVSFLVWLGAGVVGRWALFARPDVAAVLIAMCALALALRSIDKPPHALLHALGVLFFLAWAFKQSTVGIFAGVCLFELIVRRSLRNALAIAFPFALLCGIVIAVGGPAYRFNLLTAPTISGGLIPWLAVYWFREIVLPNLPIWIAVAAGVWQCARAWRARESRSRWRDPALTLLICTMAASFALDFVLLAKPGAAVNHTFESWMTSALFGLVSFLLVADASPAPGRRAYGAAAALTIAPLAFALLLLDNGPSIGLRAFALGSEAARLTSATPAEYARRATLVARMKSLPKPIFVDDEILGQPWFANDDRYPAVVLDRVFYDAAERLGRLDRDGVLSLIDDRYFAALVVPQPPWFWTRRASGAGYVRADTMAGSDDSNLAIFIRSDTAPRKPPQSRRPTSRRMP